MNRGVLIGLAVGMAAIVLGAVLWMRGPSASAPGGLQSSPSGVSASSPYSQAPGSAALPAPGSGPNGAVPGAAAPGAPGAGGTVSSLPPGRMPGDAESAAPWLAPDGSRPPATGAAPAVRAGRDGAPTLEQIQQRLQGLLASPQPDVREVDAVLADLQKNQGSKVVAGVDLQAVRDNLARSERIRQVATEMQALAAKPGPEVSAQLQAHMAEIQRLQAGMNASVAAPAGAAR